MFLVLTLQLENNQMDLEQDLVYVLIQPYQTQKIQLTRQSATGNYAVSGPATIYIVYWSPIFPQRGRVTPPM